MRLSTISWILGLLVLTGLAASAQSGEPIPHYCMGCNFAGSPLAGRDFSGDVLVGANFEGAQLSAATFRGTKIVASNFSGADLRGVSFDAAECTACNFQDAKLDGATFAGVRMVAANFGGYAAATTDAALRDLIGGCTACNFQGASLAGRDLRGISMIGVDLARADLRNTRFDGSVLCWYVVDGTQRGTKCVGLKDARVNGASFLGVRRCRDPSDGATCTPVTAAALQRDSGSPLSGAVLP
ncbi:MAG: pentapeptide repeat-containing protein [Candidatus Eremiobacteraeota bacterium]|nr:pentapeptide repeat-containing protein [Candidatus Eremiobacteraeota bacterium]